MLKRTKIDPRTVGLRPKAKSTARVAAHPPKWIKPQLTRVVDEAPTDKEWLHEIKYDGYRMQRAHRWRQDPAAHQNRPGLVASI
jgi:ATP-dependent DNA ligase